MMTHDGIEGNPWNKVRELQAEIERLRTALQDLLRACEAIGVFKNGVEHNGIDEGETIVSGYMDAARRALENKP